MTLKERLLHLTGYTAGYVFLVLLERAHARLEERAELEREAALERAVRATVRLVQLEEELEAFDASDVLTEHDRANLT